MAPLAPVRGGSTACLSVASAHDRGRQCAGAYSVSLAWIARGQERAACAKTLFDKTGRLCLVAYKRFPLAQLAAESAHYSGGNADDRWRDRRPTCRRRPQCPDVARGRFDHMALPWRARGAAVRRIRL